VPGNIERLEGMAGSRARLMAGGMLGSVKLVTRGGGGGVGGGGLGSGTSDQSS